jgi:hypothetical protein
MPDSNPSSQALLDSTHSPSCDYVRGTPRKLRDSAEDAETIGRALSFDKPREVLVALLNETRAFRGRNRIADISSVPPSLPDGAFGAKIVFENGYTVHLERMRTLASEKKLLYAIMDQARLAPSYCCRVNWRTISNALVRAATGAK